MTPGQRYACAEMFRRGDISFLLHPEQQKLLTWIDERERDIAVICISRQWGKTTMLLAYAFAYLLTHPNVTVIFLAPHAKQVEDYLLPRLSFILQFLPEDLIPGRRGRNFHFLNGSTLRLEGANVGRGQRMRGDSAHLVIIDECRDVFELRHIVEAAISPMLTTTDGRIVMISTPPESPLHEFTDFFIRNAIASGDFYQATYKQNPLLSTKRLRYLITQAHKGGENNPTFRREYMADYSLADPERKVMREFDVKSNNEWFETYAGPGNRLVRMYTGLDYGYSDPCGLLFGFYDPEEGALVVEYEFAKRQMSTDDVGAEVMAGERKLRTQLPNALPEAIRVMDISPQLMADLHNGFNLKFEPAAKVPNMLAMLNRLRTSFNEGKVRINPRCTQLIFQLTSGIFDQKTRGGYVRTSIAGHLDLLDALKYLNLNVRWNESLRHTSAARDIRNLPPGQMYVGSPFSRATDFKSGFKGRPI
jgi:hypothetical protein